MVTHPKIILVQARLTPKFFTVELLKKKICLGSMNILLILLNLELRCHNYILHISSLPIHVF
jgi:hypothetical protein